MPAPPADTAAHSAPKTTRAASRGVGVCARVDQSLIPQHKAELEALIERQVGPDGGKVTVERRMEVGDWLAVWATPANLERGVFFIRNTPQGPRFLETWGGVAGPEDRADVQAWARALDPEMPVALADCFAKVLSEEG